MCVYFCQKHTAVTMCILVIFTVYTTISCSSIYRTVLQLELVTLLPFIGVANAWRLVRTYVAVHCSPAYNVVLSSAYRFTGVFSCSWNLVAKLFHSFFLCLVYVTLCTYGYRFSDKQIIRLFCQQHLFPIFPPNPIFMM